MMTERKSCPVTAIAMLQNFTTILFHGVYCPPAKYLTRFTHVLDAEIYFKTDSEKSSS